jgi:hypothetical protein
MYYSTIHHGDFLQNNLSSWAPPAKVSTAAYGPSAAIPLKGARLQTAGAMQIEKTPTAGAMQIERRSMQYLIYFH